jgi:hypothetical protein
MRRILGAFVVLPLLLLGFVLQWWPVVVVAAIAAAGVGLVVYLRTRT